MAYNRPANFIPEIWSGTVLSSLDDALVFGQVVNRDYEGEISGYGDVVKINEIGPVTFNTYSATSTGDLTVQGVSDAQKRLAIDQSDYCAVWVDDLDQAQTKPKLMPEILKKAAHASASTIDSYIASLYTEAALVAGGSRSGSTITGADITSTNILKYLSIAQQKLDENNVPEEGRWMIVPPWMAQKMVLAKIVQGTNNDMTLMRGYLGETMYGFSIFKSNNVVNGTPAADDACVMFGYKGSISLAVQVTKVEAVRPSLKFKDLVKGLFVFGAKVVRPNTLGVIYADYIAEAS